MVRRRWVGWGEGELAGWLVIRAYFVVVRMVVEEGRDEEGSELHCDGVLFLRA